MVVDEHDDDDSSYTNRQFREWNTIPPTHTECSSLSFYFLYFSKKHEKIWCFDLSNACKV